MLCTANKKASQVVYLLIILLAHTVFFYLPLRYKHVHNKSPYISKMNVYNLPVEQLQGLKEQMDNDIRSLGAAYDALHNGRTRYLDNHDVVESYQKLCKDISADDSNPASAAASKEMFVCMTSSLFVRGTLVPQDKLIVDVGTGYFLEQSTDCAKKYFVSRAAQLSENIDSIEKTIVLKQKQHNQVIDALQRKTAAIQAAQAEQA